LSSVAISASRSARGIDGSGTKMRRSTWYSLIASSFSSKTCVPWSGWIVSSAVTDGSDRCRTVNAHSTAAAPVETRRGGRGRRSGQPAGAGGDLAVLLLAYPFDYTAADVTPPAFASVGEQLARIRRGAAEIIVESELD